MINFVGKKLRNGLFINHKATYRKGARRVYQSFQ